MSLAWRILLFALLLNVITLGSVQVFVHYSQERWFLEERENSNAAVLNAYQELNRVYSAESLSDTSADAQQVRKLLGVRKIRALYDDVIVTSGRPPFDIVRLNVRGALHRDPDTFPHAEIERAFQAANEVDGQVSTAGGTCFAVRQGGDAVGFVWARPKHAVALPAALPLWSAVVALAIGAALFGIVLFVAIRRNLGQPLAQLQQGAVAVAHGSYAARLPEGEFGGEFGPVMAAFNRMAEQVESHTATLEREVRQAVEEAKQRERALVLSSRLASIGTLAAGVAHEINNPIGGMQNAVNSLLNQEGFSERQRTYLQLVLDGLQRIGRTTRRLLDFSPRAAAAGRFAIGASIERAVAFVEHRMRHENVELEVDLAEGLPELRGDAHEIQQVVLNLLLNSLDALGERGTGGHIRVRAEAATGGVALRVADDGPGMSQEDIGRVFDPFFTKKQRPDASGLGMFISFSIVQNHGGTMTIDTRPGEGFRVDIWLPAD
ncbi:MAG: HAMP domain-containing histidine kinase [Planctomycetes bacterium]|nr:HAMP domain-containing histidine kinase [Planctomycetota bacterium]